LGEQDWHASPPAGAGKGLHPQDGAVVSDNAAMMTPPWSLSLLHWVIIGCGRVKKRPRTGIGLFTTTLLHGAGGVAAVIPLALKALTIQQNDPAASFQESTEIGHHSFSIRFHIALTESGTVCYRGAS
jgi:hypothetical protein